MTPMDQALKRLEGDLPQDFLRRLYESLRHRPLRARPATVDAWEQILRVRAASLIEREGRA